MANHQTLQGKKVLLCAGPDFEDRELFYPYYRMLEAGAAVTVAGLGEATYTGKYGVPITADGKFEDFVEQKWDLVVVPGGWAPDKIRMNEAALELVRKTLKEDSVVAAICHGGWVLASAQVIEGRTVTSYKAIKDDMVHAGGRWVDEKVVVDEKKGAGVIVTSRIPDDIPAFSAELIRLLIRIPAAV